MRDPLAAGNPLAVRIKVKGLARPVAAAEMGAILGRGTRCHWSEQVLRGRARVAPLVRRVQADRAEATLVTNVPRHGPAGDAHGGSGK